MIFLDKINNLLFKSSKIKFILILFFILLFKTGIFYHANLWYHLEVAKSPFVNFFQNQEHLHHFYLSWFGSFLANIINADDKVSFFLFNLFFSFGFVFLAISFLFKEFEDKYARIAILLFFIFPVSGTVFYFVGYDSLTLFLLMLGIYFKKNYPIVILTGIALGLQHFEIGIVSTSIMLFASFINKFLIKKNDIKIVFPLVFVFGVIFGKLLLFYIFDYFQIEIISSRTDYYQNILPQMLYTFFFRFYNVIWFSVGLGWILIIKYFFSKNVNKSFLISFLCLLLLLPIIPDTTRTFSGMSFIIIFVFLISNLSFLKDFSKKECSAFFILWTIVPYGWAWEGVARPSHLSYTIGYVMKNFVNWFNIPGIESSWVWPYFHAF